MYIKNNLKLRHLINKDYKEIRKIDKILDQHKDYSTDYIKINDFNEEEMKGIDKASFRIDLDLDILKSKLNANHNNAVLIVPSSDNNLSHVFKNNKVDNVKVNKISKQKQKIVINLHRTKNRHSFKEIEKMHWHQYQKAIHRPLSKKEKPQQEKLLNKLYSMKKNVKETENKKEALALVGNYCYTLCKLSDHFSPARLTYDIRTLLENYHVMELNNLTWFVYNQFNMLTENRHKIAELFNADDAQEYLKEQSQVKKDMKFLDNLLGRCKGNKKYKKFINHFAIILLDDKDISQHAKNTPNITITKVISITLFNKIINKSIKFVKSFK